MVFSLLLYTRRQKLRTTDADWLVICSPVPT